MSNKIVKLLNADVTEKSMTYKDLQCFNFYMLAVRLNARAGVILNLTWNDLNKLKRRGKLEIDSHKTGHLYDAVVKIKADQWPWIERLREQFFSEHKFHATRIFSSSQNRVEHSMARRIKEVFTTHFSQSFLKSDFNSNSLRKMWDTHFAEHSNSIPSEARTFHKSQSGHRPETANKYYVVPNTGGVDYYDKELSRSGNNTSTSLSVDVIDRDERPLKSPAICREVSSRTEMRTPGSAAPEICSPAMSSPALPTPRKTTLQRSNTIASSTPVSGVMSESTSTSRSNDIPDHSDSGDNYEPSDTDSESDEMDSNGIEERCESTATTVTLAESVASPNSVSSTFTKSSQSFQNGITKSNRQSFQKSLMSFRTDVSDKIKNSLKLFMNFSHRPLKKEVEEVLAKTEIILSPPEFKFVYDKIKTAANSFFTQVN